MTYRSDARAEAAPIELFVPRTSRRLLWGLFAGVLALWAGWQLQDARWFTLRCDRVDGAPRCDFVRHDGLHTRGWVRVPAHGVEVDGGMCPSGESDEACASVSANSMSEYVSFPVWGGRETIGAMAGAFEGWRAGGEPRFSRSLTSAHTGRALLFGGVWVFVALGVAGALHRRGTRIVVDGAKGRALVRRRGVIFSGKPEEHALRDLATLEVLDGVLTVRRGSDEVRVAEGTHAGLLRAVEGIERYLAKNGLDVHPEHERALASETEVRAVEVEPFSGREAESAELEAVGANAGRLRAS